MTTVEEIETKLRMTIRRRKRTILEFTRQFGWCISMAFKTTTIHEHDKIAYYIDRTVDMLEIARCLIIRDNGGGTNIDVTMARPTEVKTWEDWFEFYQHEISQGIRYDDGKVALEEIEASIRHFKRTSDNIGTWHENFERVVKRIHSYNEL